jgi:hypothetical protein
VTCLLIEVKEMKIRALILNIVFASMLAFTANAQNNVVSKAIQAFAENNYQQAFDLAGDALANIDELSGDYIPAAYYYLAKSRIQVLRIAMETNDKEKLNRMQNALIESYFDYKEALKTADNKLMTDIQQDLLGIYNPILQTGLSALNTSGDPRQPENVREAALKASVGYLAAAKDISPTYLACDLLGQAKLFSGDSLEAHGAFSESIAVYVYESHATPDFLMAYVFFRKALIERYHQKNNQLALTTLLEGENHLNAEYNKYGASNLTPESRKAYENGLTDLIGFELDIYLADKSLEEEALIRFQEIMMKYPEDYDIHIAYANLLEDVDYNLAIDAYETAISIDDTKELAYFNLGAVYNNLGSELYLAGLNIDDDAAADSLYNESNTCFRQAFINMESAYNLNPQLLQTIRSLVQLATSLGLDEKAEFYKQKEAELRGF